MPRFMIERTFPSGLAVPMTPEGAAGCARIIAVNAERGGDLVALVRESGQDPDLLCL